MHNLKWVHAPFELSPYTSWSGSIHHLKWVHAPFSVRNDWQPLTYRGQTHQIFEGWRVTTAQYLLKDKYQSVLYTYQCEHASQCHLVWHCCCDWLTKWHPLWRWRTRIQTLISHYTALGLVLYKYVWMFPNKPLLLVLLHISTTCFTPSTRDFSVSSKAMVNTTGVAW